MTKRQLDLSEPIIRAGAGAGISRRTALKLFSVVPFASAIPRGYAGAAASSKNLNFLAIGDWGVSGSAGLKSVAATMGDYANSTQPDFIVSLGDNFYPSGVLSVTDALWNDVFETTFESASLHCPWYSILGNHDYKRSPSAQIDYSAVSSRWSMPSFFYKRTFPLSTTETVELFFLDTTALASRTLSWQRFSASHSPDEQLAWFASSLAASSSKWKIVVGHHPVYSGGPHGDTDVLVTKVDPLLKRFGVKAYINGHDHNFQHIEKSAIHYFTSGNGAKLTPATDTESTKFMSSTLGFLSVSLSSEAMRVSFVDSDRRVVHEIIIEA